MRGMTRNSAFARIESIDQGRSPREQTEQHQLVAVLSETLERHHLPCEVAEELGRHAEHSVHGSLRNDSYQWSRQRASP